MPDLIAYEDGELDEQETAELFAELITTGLVWQLQGHYGRTAMAMISEGVIVVDDDSGLAWSTI